MNTGISFIVTVPSGFELEAKREIEGILPGSKVRSLFFKGNLLVEFSLKEEEAVKKLKDSETLCIGRVFPVDAKVAITPEKESIFRLYELLEGSLNLKTVSRSGARGGGLTIFQAKTSNGSWA